jgi:outer membrane protein assembly factor BamB
MPTAVLAIYSVALLSAVTGHWPDFRGPRADGSALAGRLPMEWSESKNVRWKTAIPGRGWSTPVIWGDQIWMTTATADGKQLFAICVDRDSGRVVHEIPVFDVATPESINPLNSYASPSPVIEAGRVFVHFGTYGTACLDTATAKPLWTRRDLKLDHKEGPGASPLLVDDLLIVPCDGMDVQYLVALDKRTGETRWKTDRSADLSAINPDFRKAYATPVVIELDGVRQIFNNVAHAGYAYDPRTGREIWQVPYKGFSNVSRPIVGHGLVFLNTGYTKPELWAVRPPTATATTAPTVRHATTRGAARNATPASSPQVVWKYNRSVPAKPSVVLVDDLLYFVSDSTGIVTCLEATTGREVWTHRLGGNFSASPISVAGRIYLCAEDGRTTVIAAGRNYLELAANHLDDGFMASPAVAGESLYLRTTRHLYRIEAGATPSKP